MKLLEKVWHVPTIECEGCARAIHRVLESIAGVCQVEVDLQQKTVRVVFDAEQVETEVLQEALKAAGFPPQA
ncbi:MAG: heavy-metal-associated domain-containing protein [Fimbriimonadales bacterium]|nr:heavy-metal-associated domain-containing protein [Fimbriimonadales bacterium]MDW8052476.1 heavy metal-associated domain-containing protein [Armatimonadota bacterium]